MKKLFYALYALFFNISRIFPVRQNRIALVSPHNEGFADSLGALRVLLENEGGYDIRLISTCALSFDKSAPLPSLGRAIWFFTRGAYLLATSHFIFLNDNFMPMASLNFSKKAIVTQLWHAEGAFKKFGLSLDLPADIAARSKKCAEKLTYVVCSSEGVKPMYAQAFGVDESKVLPLGSPRTDAFFAPFDYNAEREKFDLTYPACRGKKLVLYAPTFRDKPEADRRILDFFDSERFYNELGSECCLLIRLHPQIHSCAPLSGAVDVTGYCDTIRLVQLCDMLITDYSSICMDFALVGKPCVFYARDLEEYSEQRPFYFDCESYAPGDFCTDFDSLLDAIKNPRSHSEKLADFRNFNFDNPDGNAARRIYERIIKSNL